MTRCCLTVQCTALLPAQGLFQLPPAEILPFLPLPGNPVPTLSLYTRPLSVFSQVVLKCTTVEFALKCSQLHSRGVH